jgi:hypothetical protein
MHAMDMETGDDLMEVGESKFGKGVFARSFIPAGTVLFRVDIGEQMDLNGTRRLGERESHPLQVDIDRYILCGAPFIYYNHSCNPNCAVNSKMEFITLKNIREGEEMFWDYSTSMLERSWTMKCACGEKDCRRVVTDFDLLPHMLQEKYLRLNIVLPFIAHIMRQHHAKRA